MMPRATYRVQFHRGFPFAAAGARAAYFGKLGISHLYASPILKARSGSMHGYDVVDPSQIDPELGGEQEFCAMAQALRANGLGIVLDIVPNHMATSNENAWWMDVLANGPKSAFAHWFDIDWHAPGLEAKVLAPFLGEPLDAVLVKGQLKLIRENYGVAFAYYDRRFPLCPEDQTLLANKDVTTIGKDALATIHRRQHYELAWWRDAGARINWRRFFEINDLIALNADRDDVFAATHGKILDLYAEGLIDGVRVDHIDGIADPRAWCRRLRARLDGIGRRHRPRDGTAYIVVEKILADGEQLAPDWQIDGTTGYDFMSDATALLHDADADDALGGLWRDLSGRALDFEAEELLARREVLEASFAAQTASAARAFLRADVKPDESPNETIAATRTVLRHLRAYRTYATGRDDSPPPGDAFAHAIRGAKAEVPALEGEIARIARRMAARDCRAETVEAVHRFNQLAPSIAAKAVEDRAFYRYGRLLSRNDVGSDPRRHALSVPQYHLRIAERRAQFPCAMLATATHDHKRGEDARARLAVLSEVPEFWETTVRRWFAGNARLRRKHIDPGDEYILYQTLFAAWPYGATEPPEDFAERITRWTRKFLREAGLRSSWTGVNEPYERTLMDYASALIADRNFASDLARTVTALAAPAVSNSIVQTALRCLAPGIPDLYQGCEHWDLSLVDPDNRSAVDFDQREASIETAHAFSSDVSAWYNGTLKQHLIAKLLGLRRDNPALFTEGLYRPLETSGACADHIVAYRLSLGEQALVVIGNLRMASALMDTGCIVPAADWWQDTSIEGPGGPLADQLFGGQHLFTLKVGALPQAFPVRVFLQSPV